MMRQILSIIAVILLFPAMLEAQDAVAEVPSEDRRIEANEQQRYFLIGASQAQAPEEGYALLLVLPGGDGSADFHPFIRRIGQHALPEGFLVAQLVALPVQNPNQIVWPTAKDRQAKQPFTTEAFIDAVVADVKARHTIDDKRVYALAWSSGGPALYAAALREVTPIVGSFIAMSVFFPGNLPPLKNAKGRRFYLLQSPQDQVTKHIFATNAKRQLTAAGAQVQLKDYPGGHDWHGDVFGNIREGIEWLDRRD